MGTYLNPGNSGFAGIRNDIYVDKSGLIELVNQTIDTPRRLTCVSRPRRFGKSFAALMLCAYYDKTCDSRRLFDDLEIARLPSYEAHLNRYDVLYLNMTDALGETSAAESLLGYIARDERGLGRTVAQLLGGAEAPVDVNGFANDLVTFKNQDDVLTLLIHLGYLAYDEGAGTARIPNEKIRLEFARTIREDRRPDTMRRVRESEQLILDTIHGDAEAVAAQIEKVRLEATNPLNANNENALRAVIQLAYFSYKDYYVKLEELPAGRGYADIVYLPKRDASVPALVVELKWDRSAKAAIDQIKARKYPEALRGYDGEILLVGISYDRKAPAGRRRYACAIERLGRD